MRIHHRPIVRVATAAAVLLLLSLCLSCAPLMPRFGRPAYEDATILEIQHSYSRKSSDCLAVCADMVLQYYGVEALVPDTALPLELLSLSRRLNAAAPVDDEGHVLFATVLDLAPEELAAQLTKKRPLIVVFKPSARNEYHSVVVSGYSMERGRFYVNDPAKRKPSWKKLSRIPTFMDSGKYLVLLIGLREP